MLDPYIGVLDLLFISPGLFVSSDSFSCLFLQPNDCALLYTILYCMVYKITKPLNGALYFNTPYMQIAGRLF